jgi:NAD(P)-dependent dehydrogenase (short-subunit alcohol dehydrogenase family)
MRIEGTTWVVTGGGNGMGRELVLELLRRGGRVAAVDVRADALAETVALAQAAERLSIHVVDITDRDAVQDLVPQVERAHGTVDGIINNAGIIQPFVPVAELSYPDIERVLNVNLMGTIHMVKAFLPVLLARPEGYIANVSSMGGFFPFPGQSMYGASKAAVKLLTEGLYAELLDTDVHVSVIMPGAVEYGNHAELRGCRSRAAGGCLPDADDQRRRCGSDHAGRHRAQPAPHLRRQGCPAHERRDPSRAQAGDPFHPEADEVLLGSSQTTG